jgi:hypothetical protein
MKICEAVEINVQLFLLKALNIRHWSASSCGRFTSVTHSIVDVLQEPNHTENINFTEVIKAQSLCFQIEPDNQSY